MRVIRGIILSLLTAATVLLCMVWLARVFGVPFRYVYRGERVLIRCNAVNHLELDLDLAGDASATAPWRHRRSTHSLFVLASGGMVRLSAFFPLNPPRLVSQETSVGSFRYSRSNARAFGRRTIMDKQTVRMDVPAWVVFAMVSAYPAVAFVRGPARRWHRAWHGRCLGCGYSLRGMRDAAGVDFETIRAARARAKFARDRRQVPRWIVRGTVFGALAPAARLCLQICFPDNAYIESGYALGLLVFPGAHLGIDGLVASYILNVIFYGGLTGLAAFALHALRRAKPDERDPGESSIARCPECGMAV